MIKTSHSKTSPPQMLPFFARTLWRRVYTTSSRDAVLIEVRPGTGGAEAAAFADDVLAMLRRASHKAGWAWTPRPGRSAEVAGVGAASTLARYEAGVHAVKRVPVSETRGRTHTSTATVAVLTVNEQSAARPPPLPDDHITIETFRSSGPGGQHANVTESAVRVTHTPTGLTATCSSHRSQHRNKAAALSVLAERVAGAAAAESGAARAAERKHQVGTAARSERVRTYFLNRGFVADHRTGAKVRPADAVLSGERLAELLWGGKGG